jgi:hypothetical protein
VAASASRLENASMYVPSVIHVGPSSPFGRM